MRSVSMTVRSAREKLKVSQAKLAKEAGVSRRTIQYLENGFGNPTLYTLSRVFQVLSDLQDNKITLFLNL